MGIDNKNFQIHFLVSEHERDLIMQNIQKTGIKSMGEYMRKMAIKGYIVELDLSEIKKLISLLSNATNNLNQIAKRVNETVNFYNNDLNNLKNNYEQLCNSAKDILVNLSEL